MLLPFVIDPQNLQIARAVDHIDHAVSVMGIEHVGLGGDFIRQVQQELNLTPPADSLLPPGLSWESAIEGLSGPEGYPRLVEALHERGYDDDALRAVAGGNFLRLFRSALPG
jgi:membrane dipeptidase